MTTIFYTAGANTYFVAGSCSEFDFSCKKRKMHNAIYILGSW